MIDWNKPVQTKDGLPVKIVTRDGHEPFPVIGYIDRAMLPTAWTISGRSAKADADLVNIPDPDSEPLRAVTRAVAWLAGHKPEHITFMAKPVSEGVPPGAEDAMHYLRCAMEEYQQELYHLAIKLAHKDMAFIYKRLTGNNKT